MTAFMEFLSANELTIVICLMVVIFVLIMSIIIIDIFSKQKNHPSLENDELIVDDKEDTNIKINQEGFGMIADEEAVKNIDISNINKNLERTQEIEEIKYVEDDEELEKTKALLELEVLKKELAKMEESQVEEEKKEPETKEVPLQNVPLTKEPLIEPEQQIEEKKNEVIPTEEKIELQNEVIPSPTIQDEVTSFEMEQEENAIISVDELAKASMTITDEEIAQYEDDGNEPISLKELEEMYKSVEEEQTQPLAPVQEEETFPSFDLKVKPKEEAYDDKNFKNTPVISPVFGMKPTESSILLEQTANLDKLNEEIRKTNEFLSALKELRKNLE